MRKKTARSPRHSNAFSIAIFIGSLLILLILSAVIIKIVLLFTQSTFDGKHQFVVAVKESTHTRFLVFNPDTQSISSLLLSSTLPKNPVFTLGVPVDGTVTSSEDVSSPNALVKDLFFHPHAFHTSLTPIDAINLFVFLHTADTTNPTTLNASSTDSAEREQVFAKAFYNDTIFKEGKTIAISNGTNISGVGTKVAILLKDMGANVVSVTTADTPIAHSSIGYTGESSYTLSRLEHILNLPAIHLSGVAISDINITLGADTASLFQ